MKVKWSGILVLVLMMIAIGAYKVHTKRATAAREDGAPRVLLVADLSEADSADACAEIIHSVWTARERGVHVQEISPDSKSEMLRRYSVLTVPTVLILDRSGQVVRRFEGEDRQTVTAVQTELARLR